MFSSRKGEFNYLKKQALRTGLFSLLLVVMSVGLFLIGYFNTHTVKNLFTVAAVLGMLPASKIIVSMIMYMKAEKFSCPVQLKDEILNAVKDSGLLFGFDFYLTSYNKNFPLSTAFTGNSVLIGLLNDKTKNTADECEKHIKEYLKKNGIDITCKIFDNKDKYLERVSSICSNEQTENTQTEKNAFALLKNISL